MVLGPMEGFRREAGDLPLHLTPSSPSKRLAASSSAGTFVSGAKRPLFSRVVDRRFVGGGPKGNGKKARAGLIRACMSH